MSIIKRVAPKQIYIIAITTLVVIIVSNQLLIQKILEEKKDDATIINLAGRQRMLSQKIAKNVYLSENNEISVEVLNEDVRTWSFIHQALISGDELQGIEPNDNEYIESLFLEIEPHFEAIRNSLSNITSQDEVVTSIPIIKEHERAFLTKMDEIVDAFEAVSNKAVNKLIWIEIFLGLFSLIILGGEIYLVFKVFLIQIRSKNEELEESLKELSNSKGELFEHIQRFDLSLKAIDAGIWDWFIGDNTEWWSPRFYEMLGYKDNEIEASYNTFINGLVHPEDKEAVVKAVEEHLENKVQYKIEIRMKMKSGEYQWFETVGRASFEQDDKPIRMVGSIININDRKEVEAELEVKTGKLQETVDTLQEIQEVAKIGAWEVDLTTMMTDWSDEVYRIHEVELGTTVKVEDGINFYREDFRNTIQSVIDKAIANNENWDEECVLITAKGREIWVRAIGYPVFEDGELVRLRGLFMDIDENKRKALELDEANEKLQLSVEAGEIAIWMWDLRTNKLKWNDKAYEVFGVDREIEPTFEMFGGMIHPDDIDLVTKSTTKTIETRERFDIVFRFNRQDGKEIMLSGRGDVVYDSNNTPIELIGINLDITERMRMLDMMKLKESQLLSFVEQAPAAVAMLDIDMKYITVSNEWFTQYNLKKRDLAGISHYEVFPEINDMPEWLEQHQRILKGEELSNPKDKIVREDGKIQWISWKIIPWYKEKDVIGGMIMFTADITSEMSYTEKLEMDVQKRTKELASANEELESFSYSISHDLRAPLRSIHGFSDILLEDYKDKIDENGVRLINVVKDSATKMGQLIDDILQFSRLGRKAINFDRIDMNTIFNMVIEDLSIEYNDKKKELTIKTLHSSSGDIALIKQVVYNLVSNAYKYSATKDKISVIVESQLLEDFVVYSITDKGVGFNMKYHDKLFGVFQRLHTDSEFEGTGVGLAIVRRIINKHGGKIWADSELNKGSTFYFTLPRKDN